MYTTTIEVSRARGGSIRCGLGAGALAPRLVHRTHDGVRIALVATIALLLAGDDVRIDVRVGPGLSLEIVEAGGTVAYDMRGGAASWGLRAMVSAGSALVWSGLPLVVSGGADVERRTELELAGDAVALLRETVVLGRSGEVGGELRSSTTVARDGQPVLREYLDLGAAHRHDFAVLGPHRCLDTLTLLGGRLDDGPDVLQLAAEASIARSVTTALHESTLADRHRLARKRTLDRGPASLRS
jgi:urease accessory protein